MEQYELEKRVMIAIPIIETDVVRHVFEKRDHSRVQLNHRILIGIRHLLLLRHVPPKTSLKLCVCRDHQVLLLHTILALVRQPVATNVVHDTIETEAFV